MSIILKIIDILKTLLLNSLNKTVNETINDNTNGKHSSIELNSAVKETKKQIVILNQNVTLDDVIAAKKELVVTKPQFFLPAEARITSPFGFRILPQISGPKPVFHNGIDFGVWGRWFNPIKCPEDGIIVLNQKGPQTGITYVGIKGKYSCGYHYLMHVGSKTNNISDLVKVGQEVRAGQIVGYANQTGQTTGPHCHYSYYTSKWICVDVVHCFYSKFAPEFVPTILNYKYTGQNDPENKTGNACGEMI